MRVLATANSLLAEDNDTLGMYLFRPALPRGVELERLAVWGFISFTPFYIVREIVWP